ncbi:response regulator transcription factor [Falsiroseomonas sp.]|uniref:response regulator transcription factor n=1 Tax=Falsiroseomonas sp. TaxID=2870721 RepID=UPI003F716273
MSALFHSRIAVVEDHDALRKSIVAALDSHGFQAFGVDCAEALDDEHGGRAVDVVIIDAKLPGEDGFSLSRRLREAHPGLGIVILTAGNALGDRLASYEAGADFSLGKPVSVQELCAVVRSLGRRVVSANADSVSAGDEACFTLEAVSRRLVGPGGEQRLSAAETLLLTALVRSRGHRLESWQLLQLLGQEDATKEALEVRMARLRRKLVGAGAGPHAIRAVRGVGYSLTVEMIVL